MTKNNIIHVNFRRQKEIEPTVPPRIIRTMFERRNNVEQRDVVCTCGRDAPVCKTTVLEECFGDIPKENILSVNLVQETLVEL